MTIEIHPMWGPLCKKRLKVFVCVGERHMIHASGWVVTVVTHLSASELERSVIAYTQIAKRNRTSQL